MVLVCVSHYWEYFIHITAYPLQQVCVAGNVTPILPMRKPKEQEGYRISPEMRNR